MKTNQYILLLLFLVFMQSGIVSGQNAEAVSLYDCYVLARQAAPQLELLNVHEQTAQVEVKKISAHNLPQVSAYGKAWYQSDAITVTMPVPGMEGLEIDRFQYNMGVNVDQKITDGGIDNIRKRIKILESEIQSLETEVGLYRLNELVNTYFFGIYRLQESVKILELKQKAIAERQKVIESGVNNGVIVESELKRLDAELAITTQQISELELGKAQLENSLLVLTGREGKPTQWILPQEIVVRDTLNRVETKLYESNRQYLETLKEIQTRKYIPQLNAYGQAGYSYPGLNFFENQSDAYYIVGAKLSWRLFDWSEGKKEKQILELKKNHVDIAEKDFYRNQTLLCYNQLEEIRMLEQLLESDKEVILSREAISKASASSLDNGTITTADYLDDLNAELKARIDNKVHKIRIMEARAKLAVLQGI